MNMQEIELKPEHHAVMFALIAKNTLENFGCKEGDELLCHMVREYAAQRGRRMRMRADANGDCPDTVAYMAYGEWAGGEGFSKEVISTEPFYNYKVTACPWCTAWKKHNLEEYGPYYCRCADEAIVAGFNPNLNLQVPTWLSGGTCCEFRWPQFAFSEENKEKVAQMRTRVSSACLKSWAYHTAHMLKTMCGILCEADMEKGNKTRAQICQQFKERMGEAALSAVDAEMNIDFSRIE